MATRRLFHVIALDANSLSIISSLNSVCGNITISGLCSKTISSNCSVSLTVVLQLISKAFTFRFIGRQFYCLGILRCWSSSHAHAHACTVSESGAKREQLCTKARRNSKQNTGGTGTPCSRLTFRVSYSFFVFFYYM